MRTGRAFRPPGAASEPGAPASTSSRGILTFLPSGAKRPATSGQAAARHISRRLENRQVLRAGVLLCPDSQSIHE